MTPKFILKHQYLVFKLSMGGKFMKKVLSIVAIISLAGLFQNCSQADFSSRDLQSIVSENNYKSGSDLSNQKLSSRNVASTSVKATSTSAHSQSMLVQKYFGNPIYNVRTGSEPSWRSSHAANASILAGWQTRDGKWKMYMRGSGWKNGVMHDEIGLFTQHWSTFKPFGPWVEDRRNPILSNGPRGSYDDLHLLDTVAIRGEKDIYVYYKSRDHNYRMSYSGAYSTDNGNNLTKFNNNPFSSKGPSDVVYHNGHYYHYTGHFNNNKLQVEVSKSREPNSIGTSLGVALSVGRNGSYDQKSVFGSKVFKVPGDKRWFMVYQLSHNHVDYPSRIHVAHSTDLVNWVKVQNNLPFMLRGGSGEWDQGAVWTADVFVHKEILYFYYEGWGSFQNDSSKRNTAYYSGGNSRLGGASVSVKSFLSWVNGGRNTYEPIYKVVNVRSGKVLDVAGRKNANGVNFHQWSFADLSNQKFKFTPHSDGSFKISPMHSNRCADIAGASRSSRANLHLWSCHSGDNQKWIVQHINRDEFILKNKNSNQVLEVHNGSAQNGVNVQQNHYNGGAHQKWRLVEVSN